MALDYGSLSVNITFVHECAAAEGGLLCPFRMIFLSCQILFKHYDIANTIDPNISALRKYIRLYQHQLQSCWTSTSDMYPLMCAMTWT